MRRLTLQVVSGLVLVCLLALSLVTLASEPFPPAEAASGGGTPPSVMPPHPDIKDKIRRGEIPVSKAVRDPALRKSRGIDQPKGLGDAPVAAKALQPTRTFRALAILVQFPDRKAATVASSFDSLLFPARADAPASLRGYYNAVSHGQLDVVTVNLPSAIGWKTMTGNYASYVAHDNGFGAYPANAQGLAEEAIVAAHNAGVDFSQYDNNGDKKLDTVFIVHAGPGAEWTGSLDDIWSHSWVLSKTLSYDNVSISGYTMEPEYWLKPGDMTVGVYAHEFGHALGLPDLYDTDYSSDGAGAWSLMAGGSWNGTNGSSPAFLDAWSRVALGFVAPTKLAASTIAGAKISQAEASGDIVYRLNPLVGGSQEYFLVENRQKSGYDAALPGAGLLIWHVDDAVATNDNECLKVINSQCGSRHYHVGLEQADGRFSLEKYSDGNSGDSGDTFIAKRLFSLSTKSNPNSSSYYSTKSTGVQVTNVSASSALMTATLQGAVR